MAYLTRYAGLALMATFVVALVILQDELEKKTHKHWMFLASTLPWMLGWSIRNRLVPRMQPTARLRGIPSPSENIHMDCAPFRRRSSPSKHGAGRSSKSHIIIEGLIVVILGAVLVWLAFRTWSYISQASTDHIGSAR
jgi:hypothetical protein